ncbi:peptidase M48 [Aliarcobacter trophiarum LMG 25534]|uniref:Peptidase M48 n=1 Tax=Aliarcobacter trophiarum LMG 25534 TaxID=1032241 RepID=A0AAD0VMG8_9BACT|nr:M48 family metallopeptidase [Aliarcobacter trophiarum]AXK48870.1 peptidase, M48 family [Aliarcobacter trophiarum LMG 25534]RXJ92605.1 peptidase M48 [Aliarcobacter trophiarum LMG 25534]
MLQFFIVLYCFYLFFSLYTSFMQIGFVKENMKKRAIILDTKRYYEAANYSIEKEKLAIVSSFFDFIIFVFWIGFGLKFLDSFLSFESQILKAVVFINIFLILNYIFTLPFSIYQTFKLDKKYGFSNITSSLYIKDSIKTALLTIVFGSIVIAIVSYIILSFSYWWIWAFAFIFAVIILINMLYPVIRDKMFDKFEKLKDSELEEKINTLLKDVGFKSSGVFSVDASKRDNRLNAYFGGLGRTKRVVLFDTLVEKLTHGELLAVLGHELGHFKNGDILKNIGIMGFIMFIFFAIFGNLNEELFLRLGLNSEPASIIALFLIFSPALSFFLMPLISLISRHNEYAADSFGSKLTRKVDLVSALLKLANENKSFPYSHKIYIFFYFSHPPLIERFKELGYDVEKESFV